MLQIVPKQRRIANASRTTFQDIYDLWSKEKYPTISKLNVNGYTASYRACGTLYHIPFREIKLNDLQNVIDTCGKNYSEYVDFVKHKSKTPNKNEQPKFEKSEVERLWELKNDKYYQIILMLIYNGCRISEFLDLKKKNVHLEAQYFDVIVSKTENGIRKVPIADKVTFFHFSQPFITFHIQRKTPETLSF